MRWMNMIEKKTWKEKYDIKDEYFTPEMFLNGLPEERCSEIQQMLYHMAKKIEKLEKKVG